MDVNGQSLSANHTLPIAYPGITVELVAGTDNFYEITWNCGCFSVMMNSFGKDKRADEMIISILDSVQKKHNELIFITDNAFIHNEESPLRNAIESVFHKDNFYLAGVALNHEKSVNNPVNNLRVNVTELIDEDAILEQIEKRPNAIVLSSIPMSDPRIEGLLDKIREKNLENTKAAKSLLLLKLNSNRTNQILTSGNNGEKMKFLFSIGKNDDTHREEFLRYASELSDGKILVVKTNSASAGGTNTNFIGSYKQAEALLERQGEDILVFEGIDPMYITNAETGGLHASQVRPMVDNTGRSM